MFICDSSFQILIISATGLVTCRSVSGRHLKSGLLNFFSTTSETAQWQLETCRWSIVIIYTTWGATVTTCHCISLRNTLLRRLQDSMKTIRYLLCTHQYHGSAQSVLHKHDKHRFHADIALYTPKNTNVWECMPCNHAWPIWRPFSRPNLS